MKLLESSVLIVGVGGLGSPVALYLAAAEAIKYLLQIGSLLTNTLLVYDALDMSFRNIAINKSSDCPLCGENPTITELKY